MAKQKKTAVNDFLLIPYSDEVYIGNEEEVVKEIKLFMECGNRAEDLKVYEACGGKIVEYAVTQEIKLVKN